MVIYNHEETAAAFAWLRAHYPALYKALGDYGKEHQGAFSECCDEVVKLYRAAHPN